MKPLPRVEGRSSGVEKQAELKSQPTITLPAAPAQASTLPPEILIEWAAELSRRFDRATALIALGLPDPGFALLVEEIHDFNRACLVCAASPRRKAA
jgi:hypothetical protein